MKMTIIAAAIIAIMASCSESNFTESEYFDAYKECADQYAVDHTADTVSLKQYSKNACAYCDRILKERGY